MKHKITKLPCIFLFALCGFQGAHAVAATFTVITTSDSGPGSLRQAMLDADAASSGGVIQFHIPTTDTNFNAATGVFTIRVNAALPALTVNGIIVDGTTQTAFTGNTNIKGPEVIINGGARLGNGLTINSAGCTIRGLTVNGFAGNATTLTGGIKISGAAANGNRVESCYLGTDATGSAAVPNFDGVVITAGAHNNLIGGITVSARNVISGNSNDGIGIGFPSANGNVVQGNYIGLNPAGTAALSNLSGVFIELGASNNLIGGTVAGARNVISGNTTDGIHISDKGTNGNLVQGNYIGTNAAGNAVAGNRATINSGSGVFISNGAQKNLIGGIRQNARNVIADYAFNGVWISGSQNNQVQGNYIGTNAAGTVALPNRYSGVAVTDGAQNNLIGGTASGSSNVISGNASGVFFAHTTGNLVQGNIIGLNAGGTGFIPNTDGVVISNAATGNTVGGAVSAARNFISGNRNSGVGIVQDGTNHNLVQGNLISRNGQDGVHVVFNSTGNTIRGNSIFGNGGLGINLQTSGEPDKTVTPNDPGDADVGPNNYQNFPVLTTVTSGNGVMAISGTLNSTPNSRLDLDFYRNTTLDASGYGEGEVYLTGIRVTTDSSGDARFGFSFSGAFSGQFFTATATNVSTGDTSEFSQAVPASAAMALRAATVTISTANATAAQSRIQLSFSGGLDGETATAVEQYRVFVDGHAVVVQSVVWDANRVTLELEAGTLSPGSEVVVQWQGLRDMRGYALVAGRKSLLAD